MDMSRRVSSQACQFSTIASDLTALISNQKQVGAVDGPRDSDKRGAANEVRYEQIDDLRTQETWRFTRGAQASWGGSPGDSAAKSKGVVSRLGKEAEPVSHRRGCRDGIKRVSDRV